MNTTIADIRRGDRFTRLDGHGGTYIALRAAKLCNGGTKVRVRVVECQDDEIGPNGVMELGSAEEGRRSRIIDPTPDTRVEIHERELPIHHGSDEPLPFADEPNAHMGGMTDRELEAARLRDYLPRLVEQIDDLGSERDVLVRQALTAGVSAIELASLTGLSRARIYQIRDGRR